MADSLYSDKKTLYEGSIVDVPGVLTVHYLDSPKNKLQYVVWLLVSKVKSAVFINRYNIQCRKNAMYHTN